MRAVTKVNAAKVSNLEDAHILSTGGQSLMHFLHTCASVHPLQFGKHLPQTLFAVKKYPSSSQTEHSTFEPVTQVLHPVTLQSVSALLEVAKKAKRTRTMQNFIYILRIIIFFLIYFFNLIYLFSENHFLQSYL